MFAQTSNAWIWSLLEWMIPLILGVILGFLSSYLMRYLERRYQRQSLALALAECVRFEHNLAKLTKEQIDKGQFMYSNDMLHNPSLFYDLRPKVIILEKKIISQVISFNAGLKQYDCARDNLRGSQEMTQKELKLPVDLLNAYISSIKILISSGENLLGYLEEYYPETKSIKMDALVEA